MSTLQYTPGQHQIVHSTAYYEQFKIDPSNRPIKMDHVQRLYDAIKEKNLLREFPIVVTAEGVVLDGQHRLKAAEALGTPIYFVITDQMTIRDVARTNENTNHWTVKEWLHHWSESGNVEYLKLKRFWEKYPWLLVNTAKEICSYGDRSMSHVMFKNGQYVCNDVEWAERVVSAVLDFAPYVSFYRTPTFVYAIKMLLEHRDYDHSRMLAKLPYLSRKIVKCPDVQTYMEMFTEIYNYRAKPQNHVHFKVLNSQSPLRRPDRVRKLEKEKQSQAQTESGKSNELPVVPRVNYVLADGVLTRRVDL